MQSSGSKKDQGYLNKLKHVFYFRHSKNIYHVYRKNQAWRIGQGRESKLWIIFQIQFIMDRLQWQTGGCYLLVLHRSKARIFQPCISRPPDISAAWWVWIYPRRKYYLVVYTAPFPVSAIMATGRRIEKAFWVQKSKPQRQVSITNFVARHGIPWEK